MFVVTIAGHRESLEELTRAEAHAVMDDLQLLSGAVRAATNADRVNVATLGNKEPHLHFHLIPRKVDREPRPTEAPWKDPRPVGRQVQSTIDSQVARLQKAITARST